MKKYVYNLFTTENGIRMNKETLNYISKQYKTEEEIKSLFSLFCSNYNTQTIEILHIKSLENLKKEEKKQFIIKTCKYKPNIFFEKYDIIKKYLDDEIVSISTLDNNQNIIYGIYYKDKYGLDTLEDNYGSILINFKECLNNGFLYENIFVGIEGIKKAKSNDDKSEEFICKKIIYPKIKPFEKKNSFLAECSLKILIFSCYTIKSKDYVKEIICEIKPNLVILAIHDTEKGFKYNGVKIITYPCGCISKRLPNKILNDEASNPFSIETFNRKISFISHDIVQYRKTGIFLNKNPLESFLKAFISQRSYNPFYKSDLFYDEIPNILIISQNFYPFIMEIEGVKIVSILPVENKSYLLIDLPDNKIKMFCENIS